MNKQENEQYYNGIYSSSDVYKKHGNYAPHVYIWKDILKKTHAGNKIIDIGCGTGQFAQFFVSNTLYKQNYIAGFDFSSEAIKIANEKFMYSELPLKFIKADILDKSIYENIDYNTIICTEVLEHINDDLKLLSNFKKGSLIFATVPNFGGRGHVRFFESPVSVFNRYCKCIDIQNITEYKNKHTIYLIEGIIL